MELLIQKMKTLTNQASQERFTLIKHQQMMKKIMAKEKRLDNRILSDINIKCCSNKCPKKASYYLNNSYYCWFHNIDISLKS